MEGKPRFQHGPREVQATHRTLPKQIDDRDHCAKLGNEYVVRARKAIQGYFGPDSTQYAQFGGTRLNDRKSAGGRAKIATLPQAV